MTRRFGPQRALDGVSLRVLRGDCYGLIGHNGAGKTTAMRIALGLQRADAGAVRVAGFDAARHPREARARTGGLIEVPSFHGALDGARNLELLARLQGLDRRAARREAARLLERVGLAGAGRKAVQHYSHGMRQRLGIAQALLGAPEVVLLDEPTNGLDPEGIAEVRELLGALAAEGASLVVSSHQLHELATLCNRVGVLARGRLLVEAPMGELLAAEPGRYVLATADVAAAEQRLRALGLEPRGGADGRLELELGARAPEEVARALVEAGVPLRAFAPRPVTLEEVYLRYARGDAAASAPAAPPGLERAAAAPAERKAPSRPLLAVVRYELRRLARPRAALLALAPALVGALAVQRRLAEARGSLERVAAEQQFSTTDATAYEGVAVALGAGLPLAALILAGLASQSIAGELARGTLRNLLLRPVGRVRTALGKALAVLALGLALYVALALCALGAAGLAFDYTGVVEVLPNGETFPLVPEEELRPLLRAALLAPLLPLAAHAALGFLAGALARGAAAALALALGLVVGLDLARGLARGWGAEGWLPSAYLPSPLGDTSYVGFYADVAQGVSNTAFAHAPTAAWVPLTWTLTCLGLAALALARRQID